MTNGPKFGVSLAIVVSAAREKQCERLQWSEYSSVVAASGQQLTFLETIHVVGFRGSRLVVSGFFTIISPQAFISGT